MDTLGSYVIECFVAINNPNIKEHLMKQKQGMIQA